MNFNFKTFSFLLAGAALGLTACQNDVLSPDGSGSGKGDEYTGRKFYVSAGITLPNDAGTRSATDDPSDDNDHNNTNSNGNGKPEIDDFEYGYDYENDVRTMILVFATDGSKASTPGKDQFLCYSIVSGIEKAPTGSDYTFEVLAEVKYDDLKKAYDEKILGTSGDVHVYAYCNYTANLENVLKNVEVGSSEWLDASGKIVEGPSGVGETPDVSSTIWANRSFLMTSARVAKTIFPKQLDGDKEGWDNYADKSNPFKVTSDGSQDASTDLNPIRVERSAARIDFRDASTYQDADGKPLANTYAISTEVHKLTGDTQTKEKKNLFSIQLTRMGLVNMSNEFYYLRRVASGYAGMSSATIGGVETTASGANPFVVDVDWAAKNSKIKASTASKYFNFCLFNEDGDQYAMDQWYIDDISDITKKTEDTWVGSSDNRYHIWRYLTENTIPSANDQIVVQSTGVVFKGRIIGGKDIKEKYNTNDEFGKEEFYVSEKVQDALNKVNGATPMTDKTEADKLPILYSFDGFLFAGWEELIERGAKDGVGGTLYTAVKNILANWVKGTDDTYSLDTASATDDSSSTKEVLTVEKAYDLVKNGKSAQIKMTDTDVRKFTKDQNITVYEVSNENDKEGYGYYCYYFYWIRHNDNDKSGLMGVMEFAIVRNNVYKLYVNSINQFGHPRNPADDPDPEEEDTPDEKPTRYIEVMIDVLPWVVRENRIDF